MWNLCNPLTFFIILVVVWIVLILLSGMPMKMGAILNTLIWAVLLGIIIYYLCSIGKIAWAWVVVFLPLILMAAFMLMLTFGMGIGLGIEAGKKAPMIASYFWEQKSKK
jgi:energy-coupling factor transporter transmembrane protein EcfT